MDVVRTFNTELSSLYEARPPISKAKMTQITKSAIKGLKFYKHIVQSVEKFIQKCRPEYKVPGLYVIDSIVRQSRHQFGADRDVFGPRFIKNIGPTFQNLFKCCEEDRPKIIRVLNLWQKNNVFPIDIIQPLMDMGNPNTANESFSSIDDDNQISSNQRLKESDSAHWKNWSQGNEEVPTDNRVYAEMSTKNLEKFTKAEMAMSVEESSRSSMFRNQSKPEKIPEETVKFNEKLLEFDYGDEEDEEDNKANDNQLSNHPNALALSISQNLLSNPELLRQLQQMQHTFQQNEALNSDLGILLKPEDNDSGFPGHTQHSPQQSMAPGYQQPALSIPPGPDKDDRMLHQPPLPPQDLDERSLASIMPPQRPPLQLSHDNILPGVDKDERKMPKSSVPMQDLDERSLSNTLIPYSKGGMPPLPYGADSVPYQNNIGFPLQQPPSSHMESSMSVEDGPYPSEQMMIVTDEDERSMYNMPGEPPLPPQDYDERSMHSKEERTSRRERSRSTDRSRGRSSRRRSRSKSPRRKRSRSRSHTRKSNDRAKERIREKERERDKERERKRKGLPPIRKDCISVCSRTIWMGHVPKSSTEADIRKAFEEYGTICSVDIIPPRGCAYVLMGRRQDGYKALQKLKNLRIHGSLVKMAWAPGKGVKGKEYIIYWDVDAGVNYIPFDKIPNDPDFVEFLEEGGYFDEESLPDYIKVLRKKSEEKPTVEILSKQVNPDPVTTYNPLQAHGPPMVPPPIIPSTSVNLPMVMPHLMQPQFGLPLPGLLPPHQPMVMQVPMGIPPPNSMLMVQQQPPSLLGSQALSLVGGLSAMVPRSLPTMPTSALQNLKNAAHADPAIGSPMIPTPAAGDATPTEEDGTSISLPNTSAHGSSSAPSQYNPLLGLPNPARAILPVPPPVSTSVASIPFPPPQVRFGFPPPSVRPPSNHGPPGAPPYGWPPKPSAPYTDSDSSHSRAIQNQPNASSHTFNNPHQSLDVPKDGLDEKAMDLDSRGNDKSQEMVISTDDEASMDHDFLPNDIPMGPAFPGMGDFPRHAMGLHRMRGPPGPLLPNRFPHPRMHMFPPQMGGPRGHDMHNFDHRNQRVPDMHRDQQEFREWYPRDFDGPPIDRDRRDSRRSPGKMDTDSRWEGSRRDDRNFDNHRRGYEHDRRGYNDRRDDRGYNDRRGPKSGREPGPDMDNSKPNLQRPNKQQSQDLMDDMSKLKFYQRDKKSSAQSYSQKQQERKRTQDDSMKEPNKSVESQNSKEEMNANNPSLKAATFVSVNDISKREKDREARKRSRWGRTHSEEREFQEQRRNEVEMKIRGFEKEAMQMGRANNDAQHENVSTQEQNEIAHESSTPLDNQHSDISEKPVSNGVDTDAFVNVQNVTNLLESISDKFPNLLNNTQCDETAVAPEQATLTPDLNPSQSSPTVEPVISLQTETECYSHSTETDNVVNKETTPDTDIPDVSNTNDSSLVTAES